MEKILVLLVFLISATAIAQVKWMTMDEALAAQKKEPRKILLKSYTEWCPNCKWMDKYAFSKPALAQFINDNYYPVAFDAEGSEVVHYKGATYDNPLKKNNKRAQHEFAGLMKIYEYPTLVFFDEKGVIINPVPGKLDSKKLEVYVTMLSNDTYKTINTGAKWAAYQNNFKYKLQR